MLKPEYSDYYKFVVSIGLLVISMAVVTFGFVFGGMYEALIADTGNTNISFWGISIQGTQSFAILILCLTSLFTLVVGSVGLTVSIKGMANWKRKQAALDEKEKLETEKLRQELETLSPSQIARKALLELGVVETPTGLGGQDEAIIQNPEFLLTKYLEIQAIIYKSLDNFIGKTPDFQVYRNQRIRNTDFAVDILVHSANDDDWIIETRYSDCILSKTQSQEIAGRTRRVAQAYEAETGRDTTTALLFVAPLEQIRALKVNEYEKEIGLGIIGRKTRVIFIPEEELESIQGRILFEKISHQLTQLIQKSTTQELRREKKTSLVLAISFSLVQLVAISIAVSSLISSLFIKRMGLKFSLSLIILITICAISIVFEKNIKMRFQNQIKEKWFKDTQTILGWFYWLLYILLYLIIIIKLSEKDYSRERYLQYIGILTVYGITFFYALKMLGYTNVDYKYPAVMSLAANLIHFGSIIWQYLIVENRYGLPQSYPMAYFYYDMIILIGMFGLSIYMLKKGIAS